MRTYRQRVAVKARIVRHKAKSPGAGGKSAAAAMLRSHLGYLAREGAGETRERGVLFNAEGDLPREDMTTLVRRLQEDRHHFRFIISPEAGAGLDLKANAKELVGAVEQGSGNTAGVGRCRALQHR